MGPPSLQAPFVCITAPAGIWRIFAQIERHSDAIKRPILVLEEVNQHLLSHTCGYKSKSKTYSSIDILENLLLYCRLLQGITYKDYKDIGYVVAAVQ